MWDILLFEDVEGPALVTNLEENVPFYQVREIATDRLLAHIGTQFSILLIGDALMI